MRVSKSAPCAAILLLCAVESATAFAPLRAGEPASTTKSITMALQAKPLAQEGDWSAYLDKDNTGLVYYFNGKTGESLWEPPTATFPKVMLDKEEREIASKQRKEYFGEPEKKGGFFGGILGAKNQEEKQTEAPKKEESSWIEGLFDTKAEESTKVEEKEPAQKASFFGGGTNKAETSSSINGEPDPVVKDKSFVDSIFGISKRQEGATATETRPAVKEEKIFTTEMPRTIQIDMSSLVLPHPEKMAWGGEDAVFTTQRSFGVFDGVSGAEKLDGIPLYSIVLADEMKRLLGQNGATIKELTNKLTEAAEFADRAATGASTAVVGSVDEKGFLRVLNLGDSVCMVIRNGKVVAKTREIVHYFDCPYQLSEDSPDRPRDGTKLNLELVSGDIILAGSDGVFDNLSEAEILDVVSAAPDKAATIARRVVDRSRKVSLDVKAQTPYAKLAKRNGFEDFQDGVGGKVDDISCIVVRCT